MAEAWAWLNANGNNAAELLLALLFVGELISRMTKTEKDDGVVERIGAVIRKALDFLGLPNRKKEEDPPADPPPAG